MKKYIIAVVEGIRHDLAPEYRGKASVFKYGKFDLIIWTGGDWGGEYEEVYKSVADYVTKVNAELKGNRYFSGWMRAEMLTPNEHGEYNGIHCSLFHNWLVHQIITSDILIVSKINITRKDLYDRIDVWKNLQEVTKIARIVGDEMLQSIHCPGEYIHHNYTSSETSIWLKDYPIFELGWTLPYSIQLVPDTCYFRDIL